MKFILINLILLLGVLPSFSQESDEAEYTGVRTLQASYPLGSTVKVAFNLPSGILFSNYGGCGGGPEYYIECLDNENYSILSPPHCDLGLLETNYVQKGEFEFQVFYPGTYVVTVFIPNPDKPGIEGLYEIKLKSKPFEVKAK